MDYKDIQDLSNRHEVLFWALRNHPELMIGFAFTLVSCDATGGVEDLSNNLKIFCESRKALLTSKEAE